MIIGCSLSSCGSANNYTEDVDEVTLDLSFDEEPTEEQSDDQDEDPDLLSETESSEANETVVDETETVFQTEADAPEYIKAYASLLRQIMTREGYYEPLARFQLIYVDDDIIPELAVTTNDGHSTGAELYTFENGEAVLVGSFGSWGLLSYLPRGSVVIDAISQSGEMSEVVYSYSNGETEEIAKFYRTPSDKSVENSPMLYYIDGAKVTEVRFNSEYARAIPSEPIQAPSAEGEEKVYTINSDEIDLFLQENH